MPTCGTCGAWFSSPELAREPLDEFLETAGSIQRFQVANRLDLAESEVPGAVVCADCVAAAIQWANVD